MHHLHESPMSLLESNSPLQRGERLERLYGSAPWTSTVQDGDTFKMQPIFEKLFDAEKYLEDLIK